MKKKDELFMLLVVTFIMATALDWPLAMRILVIGESILMLIDVLWRLLKR